MAWKDRRLPVLTIGFRSKRGGRTGQWNMSEDTNGRPFVRCRLFYPSLQTLRPLPSGCAAGRSLFLSSVQFKENACHDHVPIHSYEFASRRYPILVYMTRPRDLRFHFLQMWHFDARYNIAHLTIVLWIVLLRQTLLVRSECYVWQTWFVRSESDKNANTCEDIFVSLLADWY